MIALHGTSPATWADRIAADGLGAVRGQEREPRPARLYGRARWQKTYSTRFGFRSLEERLLVLSLGNRPWASPDWTDLGAIFVA